MGATGSMWGAEAFRQRSNTVEEMEMPRWLRAAHIPVYVT